jgi:hypothetical protein
MILQPSRRQLSQMQALAKITIWMTRPADVRTDWDVNSISCKSANFTDRLNIEKEKKASRCLNLQVLEAMKPYIEDAIRQGVAIDRLFEINLPGLMLRNLNICATQTKSGLISLMIIFKETLGPISRLFAPGKAPSSFQDAQTAIAATILEDVVMPTLNLCHTPIEALQKAPTEALAKRLNALMESRQDLDFYATLLTRFVAQQEQLGTEIHSGPAPLDNATSNVLNLSLAGEKTA